MPISMIHPFVVHFALSLVLLAGAIEVIPRLGSSVTERGRTLIWNAAILILLLAVLSGWRSLDQLEDLLPPPPRLVFLHRLMGIAGLGLFVILGVARKERLTSHGDTNKKQGPTLRILLLGSLLLVLSTAAVGGHLVYHDHLGTAFWSKSGTVNH